MYNLKQKILPYCPLIIIKVYNKLYFLWREIISFWIPVHIYEGTVNLSSNSLSFLYLGWDPTTLNYWLNKIFNKYHRVRGRKYIPVWKLNKFIKDNELTYDLAMIELFNKMLRQKAEDLPGFVLPKWIYMHMDINLSLSKMGKHHFIVRQIKKHSLKVEKATSKQDFLFFYENMYKPYIKTRYGASAIVENIKRMVNHFESKESVIFFVVQDGIRIAGMYLIVEKGVPYLHSVGLLDGSLDILKKGAVGALYYYAMKDLGSDDIKRINIGGTSPLLQDGLTQYKMRLGAIVSDISRQKSFRLKLMPLNCSPGLKDFLKSNPFIFFEKEQIYSAVFMDEDGNGQAPVSPDEEILGVEKSWVYNLNASDGIFKFITSEKEYIKTEAPLEN